jgi:hypothetical protein
MKTEFCLVLALLHASLGMACGQAGAVYTNFVRQVQLPTGVLWDASVAPAGEQLASLPINPNGARFELWTIKSDPLTVYLLDTRYVGTYVPMADVNIRTEDPYTYTGIPRTRADRPFIVEVTTSGLLSGADVPESSKSVKLLRHVQSYGVGGTGEGINRTQATLLNQVSLVNNTVHKLSYTLTSIPNADRTKVRGEERFSVFSLQDYQAPESQLASKFVQIWPVANGIISGMANGSLFKNRMPPLTITLNDLYPDSRTYAQVYRGDPVLGTTGTVIPGSGLVVYHSIPQNRVLDIKDWDDVITADGRWTLEVLTATPFGIDRLAFLSFNVDRTINLNGTFTTIE